MIVTFNNSRSLYFRKFVSICIIFTFIFSLVLPPQARAQVMPMLPAVGTMITPTNAFNPAIIKGVTIHPDNPLQFTFIVNKGDTDLDEAQLREESTKLIRYFLASLTVPEKEMWVNLSPYEKDRIVPESLGVTELGRDLLSQDYILKQLTASLIYPEKEIGQKFWEKVYKEAREKFGTTDIPVDTFNKVWIVPDHAKVYVHENNAFVVNAHLKVMLEADYLAMSEGRRKKEEGRETSIIPQLSSIVLKQVIIPAIEREVNEGETFATLRQIYNSMILATWYKRNLKETLLSKVYVNQNKILGVDVEDKDVKNKIYNQYLEAFKKGVYNYIKEDYDPVNREIVNRKYFSGGFTGQIGDFEVETDQYRLTPKDRAMAAKDPDKDLKVKINAVEVKASTLKAAQDFAKDMEEERKSVLGEKMKVGGEKAQAYGREGVKRTSDSAMVVIKPEEIEQVEKIIGEVVSEGVSINIPPNDIAAQDLYFDATNSNPEERLDLTRFILTRDGDALRATLRNDDFTTIVIATPKGFIRITKEKANTFKFKRISDVMYNVFRNNNISANGFKVTGKDNAMAIPTKYDLAWAERFVRSVFDLDLNDMLEKDINFKQLKIKDGNKIVVPIRKAINITDADVSEENLKRILDEYIAYNLDFYRKKLEAKRFKVTIDGDLKRDERTRSNWSIMVDFTIEFKRWVPLTTEEIEKSISENKLKKYYVRTKTPRKNKLDKNQSVNVVFKRKLTEKQAQDRDKIDDVEVALLNTLEGFKNYWNNIFYDVTGVSTSLKADKDADGGKSVFVEVVIEEKDAAMFSEVLDKAVVDEINLILSIGKNGEVVNILRIYNKIVSDHTVSDKEALKSGIIEKMKSNGNFAQISDKEFAINKLESERMIQNRIKVFESILRTYENEEKIYLSNFLSKLNRTKFTAWKAKDVQDFLDKKVEEGDLIFISATIGKGRSYWQKIKKDSAMTSFGTRISFDEMKIQESLDSVIGSNKLGDFITEDDVWAVLNTKIGGKRKNFIANISRVMRGDSIRLKALGIVGFQIISKTKPDSAMTGWEGINRDNEGFIKNLLNKAVSENADLDYKNDPNNMIKKTFDSYKRNLLSFITVSNPGIFARKEAKEFIVQLNASTILKFKFLGKNGDGKFRFEIERVKFEKFKKIKDFVRQSIISKEFIEVSRRKVLLYKKVKEFLNNPIKDKLLIAPRHEKNTDEYEIESNFISDWRERLEISSLIKDKGRTYISKDGLWIVISDDVLGKFIIEHTDTGLSDIYYVRLISETEFAKIQKSAEKNKQDSAMTADEKIKKAKEIVTERNNKIYGEGNWGFVLSDIYTKSRDSEKMATVLSAADGTEINISSLDIEKLKKDEDLVFVMAFSEFSNKDGVLRKEEYRIHKFYLVNFSEEAIAGEGNKDKKGDKGENLQTSYKAMVAFKRDDIFSVVSKFDLADLYQGVDELNGNRLIVYFKAAATEDPDEAENQKEEIEEKVRPFINFWKGQNSIEVTSVDSSIMEDDSSITRKSIFVDVVIKYQIAEVIRSMKQGVVFADKTSYYLIRSLLYDFNKNMDQRMGFLNKERIGSLISNLDSLIDQKKILFYKRGQGDSDFSIYIVNGKSPKQEIDKKKVEVLHLIRHPNEMLEVNIVDYDEFVLVSNLIDEWSDLLVKSEKISGNAKGINDNAMLSLMQKKDRGKVKAFLESVNTANIETYFYEGDKALLKNDEFESDDLENDKLYIEFNNNKNRLPGFMSIKTTLVSEDLDQVILEMGHDTGVFFEILKLKGKQNTIQVRRVFKDEYDEYMKNVSDKAMSSEEEFNRIKGILLKWVKGKKIKRVKIREDGFLRFLQMKGEKDKAVGYSGANVATARIILKEFVTRGVFKEPLRDEKGRFWVFSDEIKSDLAMVAYMKEEDSHMVESFLKDADKEELIQDIKVGKTIISFDDDGAIKEVFVKVNKRPTEVFKVTYSEGSQQPFKVEEITIDDFTEKEYNLLFQQELKYVLEENERKKLKALAIKLGFKDVSLTRESYFMVSGGKGDLFLTGVKRHSKTGKYYLQYSENLDELMEGEVLFVDQTWNLERFLIYSGNVQTMDYKDSPIGQTFVDSLTAVDEAMISQDVSEEIFKASQEDRFRLSEEMVERFIEKAFQYNVELIINSLVKLESEVKKLHAEDIIPLTFYEELLKNDDSDMVALFLKELTYSDKENASLLYVLNNYTKRGHNIEITISMIWEYIINSTIIKEIGPVNMPKAMKDAVKYITKGILSRSLAAVADLLFKSILDGGQTGKMESDEAIRSLNKEEISKIIEKLKLGPYLREIIGSDNSFFVEFRDLLPFYKVNDENLKQKLGSINKKAQTFIDELKKAHKVKIEKHLEGSYLAGDGDKWVFVSYKIDKAMGAEDRDKGSEVSGMKVAEDTSYNLPLTSNESDKAMLVNSQETFEAFKVIYTKLSQLNFYNDFDVQWFFENIIAKGRMAYICSIPHLNWEEIERELAAAKHDYSLRIKNGGYEENYRNTINDIFATFKAYLDLIKVLAEKNRGKNVGFSQEKLIGALRLYDRDMKDFINFVIKEIKNNKGDNENVINDIDALTDKVDSRDEAMITEEEVLKILQEAKKPLFPKEIVIALSDAKKIPSTVLRPLNKVEEILKDNIEGVRKNADGSYIASDVGGINLDPALLNLEIKRDANWVPLPMEQQDFEHMNIQGFIPVIIDITPAVNLPMLLGFDIDEDNNKQADKTGTADLQFGEMKARFEADEPERKS